MGHLIGGPADGLEILDLHRTVVQITVLDGHAQQLPDAGGEALAELLNRATAETPPEQKPWSLYRREPGDLPPEESVWKYVPPHHLRPDYAGTICEPTMPAVPDTEAAEIRPGHVIRDRAGRLMRVDEVEEGVDRILFAGVLAHFPTVETFQVVSKRARLHAYVEGEV